MTRPSNSLNDKRHLGKACRQKHYYVTGEGIITNQSVRYESGGCVICVRIRKRNAIKGATHQAWLKRTIKQRTEYAREYRKKNREAFNATKRRYYDKNKEMHCNYNHWYYINVTKPKREKKKAK